MAPRIPMTRNGRLTISWFLSLFLAIGVGTSPLARTDESRPDNDSGSEKEKTGPIYSVKTYDPKRNTAEDLSATIQQATRDKKRILLEIGGLW